MFDGLSQLSVRFVGLAGVLGPGHQAVSPRISKRWVTPLPLWGKQTGNSARERAEHGMAISSWKTLPIRCVVQGIVGSTPWNALVFLTFYFQLLGMSDFQASLLLAVFLATNAIGRSAGGPLSGHG